MNATMTAIRKVDHITESHIGRIVWGSRYIVTIEAVMVDGKRVNKQIPSTPREYVVTGVDYWGVPYVSPIKKDGSISSQTFCTGSWLMLVLAESECVTEIEENA